MVFQLPRPPMFLPPGMSSSARAEQLWEGGVRVDYHMERLGLAKRRVSGGILVDAADADIWAVLTAFEDLPKVVPNILSNKVTRRADGAACPAAPLSSCRVA